MEQLDRRGMVLHGSISHNTYTDDMLKSNPKSNLTTTLDHFEKWIGILKMSKILTLGCKTGKDENASGDIQIRPNVKHTDNENADKVRKNNEMGHTGNADINNEENTTQKDISDDSKSRDVTKSGDVNDATREGDITKCYDVIPPSCKRQLCSSGAASEGNAAADQDSLELARPKFERRASLTAAFELSNSARDWLARRVDLIIVPASQYYYALVGWTGSKQYNR